MMYVHTYIEDVAGVEEIRVAGLDFTDDELIRHHCNLQ
jgi:hypothetical protein